MDVSIMIQRTHLNALLAVANGPSSNNRHQVRLLDCLHVVLDPDGESYVEATDGHRMLRCVVTHNSKVAVEHRYQVRAQNAKPVAKSHGDAAGVLTLDALELGLTLQGSPLFLDGSVDDELPEYPNTDRVLADVVRNMGTSNCTQVRFDPRYVADVSKALGDKLATFTKLASYRSAGVHTSPIDVNFDCPGVTYIVMPARV